MPPARCCTNVPWPSAEPRFRWPDHPDVATHRTTLANRFFAISRGRVVSDSADACVPPTDPSAECRCFGAVSLTTVLTTIRSTTPASQTPLTTDS